MQAVLRERRAQRFRSTLSSLTALCAAVEDMLAAELGTTSSLDRPLRSADNVDSAWALLKETRSPELLNDVYALFSSYDDGSGGLDSLCGRALNLGIEQHRFCPLSRP